MNRAPAAQVTILTIIAPVAGVDPGSVAVIEGLRAGALRSF
jgi:hypothetical protein